MIAPMIFARIPRRWSSNVGESGVKETPSNSKPKVTFCLTKEILFGDVLDLVGCF